MNMDNEAFYDARKALGLKRTELAKALGMSRTTINAYEAGTNTVPQHVWLAMKTLENIQIDVAIQEILDKWRPKHWDQPAPSPEKL